MFCRVWSFVSQLLAVHKKLVAIYQLMLKILLTLTFNLIVLQDSKSFQMAIMEIIKQILLKEDNKWLFDGIKNALGEKSGDADSADSKDDSAENGGAKQGAD
ncbi:MAG: hypothetical protein [Microviridae sp.]|nr:MAG: hypothetical protein [Microviridae sp.]AXQ66202.1 MAG: hypothetical protein [Microviridae sp.]